MRAQLGACRRLRPPASTGDVRAEAHASPHSSASATIDLMFNALPKSEQVCKWRLFQLSDPFAIIKDVIGVRLSM